MPATMYRPPTEAERKSPQYQREVLATKLRIWTKRALYAKGARKAECLAAVADLQAQLAAVAA